MGDELRAATARQTESETRCSELQLLLQQMEETTSTSIGVESRSDCYAMCKLFMDRYDMSERCALTLLQGKRLEEKGQLSHSLRYLREVLRQCPDCEEASIQSEMIQRALEDRRTNSSSSQQSRHKCFLPDTMMWTSATTTKKVDALVVGDYVVGFSDEMLEIVSKQVHAEEIREVVKLKTRRQTLSVTSDHRVPVSDTSSRPSVEKSAAELRVGDLVFCGQPPEPLVKVETPSLMRTVVVELRFRPDEPVESFIAPRWALATMGASEPDDASIPNTEDGY